MSGVPLKGSATELLIDGIRAVMSGACWEQTKTVPNFHEFLRTKHEELAKGLTMPAETGVDSMMLPPRSPNLNAYAERFVPTIKESCLELMILFGESAVRKATTEFMAHYHRERNPQGLANALIWPEPEHAGDEGEVQRRERLGGLLNYYYYYYYYYRQAAENHPDV